jgi:hypothetical protein
VPTLRIGGLGGSEGRGPDLAWASLDLPHEPKSTARTSFLCLCEIGATLVVGRCPTAPERGRHEATSSRAGARSGNSVARRSRSSLCNPRRHVAVWSPWETEPWQEIHERPRRPDLCCEPSANNESHVEGLHGTSTHGEVPVRVVRRAELPVAPWRNPSRAVPIPLCRGQRKSQ